MVLSLVFFTWFVSGIVLMYCPFPSVTDGDRWARAASLDPAQVRITPDQALQAMAGGGDPSQVRLDVLDGRPVYHIAFGGNGRMVFADDGHLLPAVTQAMALRTGARWSRLAPQRVAFERLLREADQWTVNLDRDCFPAWKFGWPDGQEVYVAQSSGEVIQYTTRRSRLGAYFGAIPHWFYFASLRRHAKAWSRTVIWVAGLGLTTAVLGLAGGIWIYAICRRVPYRGIKYWHVVLGLGFGTVATTWVFSGLLSVEPFAWLHDQGSADLDTALHGKGIHVARFVAKLPQEALAEAGHDLQVKELEFDFFDGEAVYLATESARKSRVVPMHEGPLAGFDAARIAAAVVRAAAPARLLEARIVTRYEPYYVDRQKSLPLPVLCVRVDDAIQSRAYIDFRTGRVIQSYGTRGRVRRWLYHGLHSLDLPWLYTHRPMWDVIVVTLMLGGAILSVTSLPLAWQMVMRTLRSR